MPTSWTCSHGHRWQPDGTPSCADCPTCGGAGKPLPDTDQGASADSQTLPPPRQAQQSATVDLPPTPNPSPAASKSHSGGHPRKVSVPGFDVLEEIGRGGM